MLLSAKRCSTSGRISGSPRNGSTCLSEMKKKTLSHGMLWIPSQGSGKGYHLYPRLVHSRKKLWLKEAAIITTAIHTVEIVVMAMAM